MNVHLLLALFTEEELKEMHSDLPPKQPETAFCCNKLIDEYIPVCPHCGGDPLPF